MNDQVTTEETTEAKPKKKSKREDKSINVRLDAAERAAIDALVKSTGYPSAAALIRDVLCKKQFKTKVILNPDINEIGTYLAQLFDLIPTSKNFVPLQQKIVETIKYIYKDLDDVKLDDSEEGEGYDW